MPEVVKCCLDDFCDDFKYMYYHEAKELATRKLLEMAVSAPIGTAFAVLENCLIITLPLDCFVRDCAWGSYIRGILVLVKREEVSGEEAQRVISLAKSATQSAFDEEKAKVLKVIFKKGKLEIKRTWDEYDVLYVGDVHTYSEYCITTNWQAEDIVAYVVLDDGKKIPVEIEVLKKYVW